MAGGNYLNLFYFQALNAVMLGHPLLQGKVVVIGGGFVLFLL